MSRNSGSEGSLAWTSAASSVTFPRFVRHGPVPQVLNVPAQAAYKLHVPDAQPLTSSVPTALSLKTAVEDDPLLPKLAKGTAPAPLNSAQRRSQQSLSSGLSGAGDASATSTPGSAITPTTTPNNGQSAQWRLNTRAAPNASTSSAAPTAAAATASARPLGLAVRGDSRSTCGRHAASLGASLAGMRNAAPAATARQPPPPVAQEQRTLAAAGGRGQAQQRFPRSPNGSPSGWQRGAKAGTTKPAAAAPVHAGESSATAATDSWGVPQPVSTSEDTHTAAGSPGAPRTAAAMPTPPILGDNAPLDHAVAATSASTAATVTTTAATSLTSTTTKTGAAAAANGSRVTLIANMSDDGKNHSGSGSGTVRTSGECGILSERLTPGAASSAPTTLQRIGLSPTPLQVFWNLTPFEEEEVCKYLPEVFFTGSIPASEKIQADWATRGAVGGGGYDDENCHYRITVGDHIAYRYEVTKELGRGTFGVVVSAIDHGYDGSVSGNSPAPRHVAIKLIKNKPAYTKQAKEEARLLQALVAHDPNDEANIVRLLDTFAFRNHYGLVFEHLQNDLYSYMRANDYKPFTQRFIFRFAESVLTSLAFLDQHGVIHCDIKPENIVVEKMEEPVAPLALAREEASAPSRLSNDFAFSRLKLIDFGSSCTVDKRPFTYIQSRYYRAPEIILGIPYTSAIDMWSFGCVLCELANGMPIFPACCEGELLDRTTEYLGPVPAYLVAKGKRVDKFFAPATATAPGSPRGPRKKSSSSSSSSHHAKSGAGAGKDHPESHSSPLSPPVRAMLPGLSKKGRLRKPPSSRSVYAFLGHVREQQGREEAHLFHDFVLGCLTFDPEKRMTPAQALHHPWMEKWRARAASGERCV